MENMMRVEDKNIVKKIWLAPNLRCSALHGGDVSFLMRRESYTFSIAKIMEACKICLLN